MKINGDKFCCQFLKIELVVSALSDYTLTQGFSSECGGISKIGNDTLLTFLGTHFHSLFLYPPLLQ